MSLWESPMRVVPMQGEWLMDRNKGTDEKEVFTIV